MRTTIMIGLLAGLLGCGDNSGNAIRESGSDASVGSDAAATIDASVSDSCIGAEGHCGCIFEETIHYGPDAGITTKVVCP